MEQNYIAFFRSQKNPVRIAVFSDKCIPNKRGFTVNYILRTWWKNYIPQNVVNKLHSTNVVNKLHSTNVVNKLHSTNVVNTFKHGLCRDFNVWLISEICKINWDSDVGTMSSHNVTQTLLKGTHTPDLHCKPNSLHLVNVRAEFTRWT